MPIELRSFSRVSRPHAQPRIRRLVAHEYRITVLTLMLIVVIGWALLSWMVLPGRIPAAAIGLMWHKIASVLCAAALSVYLFFALGFEKIR